MHNFLWDYCLLHIHRFELKLLVDISILMVPRVEVAGDHSRHRYTFNKTRYDFSLYKFNFFFHSLFLYDFFLLVTSQKYWGASQSFLFCAIACRAYSTPWLFLKAVSIMDFRMTEFSAANIVLTGRRLFVSPWHNVLPFPSCYCEMGRVDVGRGMCWRGTWYVGRGT